MLKNEKLVGFVGVSNADAARAFYRDTLGLTLVSEDGFALVFNAGGTTLRVSLVHEVRPQPYSVLGWEVKDATAMARALTAAGVPPERYSHVPQDEDGVWTAPGGAKIAWFKDPDGNILSVAQM